MLNSRIEVSNKGVEWLWKNVFKQKYLELLEKYKMELTELYIKEGYTYDEFFGRNWENHWLKNKCLTKFLKTKLL